MHQESDIDIDAPEAWNIHKGLSGQVIVCSDRYRCGLQS